MTDQLYPEAWTDKDHALVARVEAALPPALTRAKLNWREGCVYWGPTSPGALGWLLALVREAWGRPNIIAVFDHDAPEGFWRIMDGTRYPSIGGAHTEAEALVAALEAAPSPA